jgi:sec-independent protein translocase protein TatB
MFNMGFSELVVLAIIGLLVLGPEQLPSVARKVARLINEFKRATEDENRYRNPLETKS